MNRFRCAVPTLPTALTGALLWAMAMGASALVTLMLDDWQTPDRIRTVSALFAAGGALAFPPGLLAARLACLGRGRDVAFAATFVCLLGATVIMTGALFALQYRSYYAEWHAPAFTLTWMFQFVFTMLTALYQFAVLGVRLYFPLGFLALFAASAWLARQRR